jgi:hypothetical protein
VRCADHRRRGRRIGCRAAGLWLALLVGGCSGPSPAPTPVPLELPRSVQSPRPGQGTTAVRVAAGPPASPAARSAPTPSPSATASASAAPRDWDEYRRRAADRIAAANRAATYSGEVPEPLLAIPVLEIELRGDGSVQRINVLRQPRQATDTVQLAIDAVRRSAPFGSVMHLPRPWKFNEVFLFDDERRFKLRTHDQ